VIIGRRLRALREKKGLSQGDMQKRSGLLRPYISRVENGHTVPQIDALEKWAGALEVPMYQLFYDGKEPPEVPEIVKRRSADDTAWGSSGRDGRYLLKVRRLLGRMDENDRLLILGMVQKMTQPARRFR